MHTQLHVRLPPEKNLNQTIRSVELDYRGRRPRLQALLGASVEQAAGDVAGVSAYKQQFRKSIQALQAEADAGMAQNEIDHFIAAALGELREGAPVSVAQTPAYGCTVKYARG